MNIHVEDEIEGCDYIFSNMSEDDGWQRQKNLLVQI